MSPDVQRLSGAPPTLKFRRGTTSPRLGIPSHWTRRWGESVPASRRGPVNFAICLPLALLLASFTFSAAAIAADVPDDTELPWSFAPLVHREVDSEKYPNWALDDLDRFIAERLEAEDLRPNSGADRRTLIRRAAFDLTGLPPTLDEIESFLSNPANDQIAGLIADLKQRDMLDETLIVWGGEFGRGAHEDNNGGRGHNGSGFTFWMAGGGVKGGQTYGATDETGAEAVEDEMDFHDLHATVLHLLGLDHRKLTYRYAGRDFRLTDTEGRVARKILA